MQKILEDIGLTPGEAKVYLALLELGESNVTPIAKKSEVSLSKIYSITNGLIKKGLVSSIIKNKVKKFHAAQPERIIEYLKEKRKIIENEEKIIIEKLPELNLKYNNTEEKPIAEVYEGLRGMKTFFEYILLNTKRGETIYALGIPKESSEKYEAYFLHDWNKRRIKKGVLNKVLYNANAREAGAKRAKTQLMQLKYLPEEIKTPSWIQIAGDAVATIHATKTPVCIVVKNKDIADSHKSYFNYLWKKSKS
ncbi:hypothetical protein J4226_03430 [Candidatus Pacearchaeota archaeon]|nr:hypothetical protein [Candidatus Pacearchaeota archaeon]